MDPREIIAMIMALRTARLAIEGQIESQLDEQLKKQAKIAARIYFHAQATGVPEWSRLMKESRDAEAKAGKADYPKPGKETTDDGGDESDSPSAGA